MPSETMNFPGFFADDASLPREISGFWKSNNLPNYYGGTGKTVARSPVENIGALECQPAKSLELYQSLMQDQKVNESFGRDAVGTNKAFMLRPDVLDSGIRSNLNVQQKHHYAQSGQNENSLFSHSLSELVSRKLRSSSNNVPYDQSVDAFASHVVEEEPLEPLEEIEAQTIGNLLPTDDDLFNEMTDKMNNIQQQLSGKDDIEELDVFSSLGGLDLGNDGFAAQNNNEFTIGVSNGKSRYRNGSLAGGNPFSAYPSRTIFARNININIEDSELRALFEKYGDIQAFYTSFKHRGFVMISYYDIRSATNAKQALQNVQLRHHKLDIHYSNPKDNSDEDINQGAVVILNLDSSISIDELRQIFCAFGDVKEIRETSPRSQHKFIEFYDLRAAGAAFRALNGSNIEGKQINLELNRAGGSRCLFQRFASDFEQDECHSYAPQSIRRSFSTNGFPGTAPHGGIISSSMDDGIISGFASAKQSAFMESAFGHGISSSVPNSMSSRLTADSSTNQTGFGERGQQLKYDIQGTPNSHPHSLPDNYDDLKNTIQSMGLMPSERTNNRKLHKVRSNGHLIEFDDGVYGSAVNGSCSLSGHHYGWGNLHNPHSPGVMWSNSPTFTLASPTERVHGSSPVFSSALPVKNQQQHMGSAPSGNGSLWERRRAYAGKSSSDGAGGGFHSGSLGSLRVSDTTTGGGSLELVSPNMLPNYMELSVPPKGAGFQPHHQRSPMRSPLRSPMRSPIFPGRGQMSPISNSFESPNERSRSRRNEGSINPADKKQYELDLDRILQGDDKRTTLMIKNIPNKYTSKMLLAAIDEHHRGTYDFIYLPIDFKNKCNVGYAFINMIDPCQIVPFYKAFNGKKWEKFNSEKIASIAYARIQGKAALVAHFQNSSLMNEDKRCRPILFNTDGPNAGDQVPFPTGINVRTRPAKTKTPSSQEDNQLTSSEEFSNGDTSSGSGRDSD